MNINLIMSAGIRTLKSFIREGWWDFPCVLKSLTFLLQLLPWQPIWNRAGNCTLPPGPGTSHFLPPGFWQAAETAWHLDAYDLEEVWGHPFPLQRQYRSTFHKLLRRSLKIKYKCLCGIQLSASLMNFPSCCFISPSSLFFGITS